jgi:chromatin remodeling complex protein RSC6
MVTPKKPAARKKPVATRKAPAKTSTAKKAAATPGAVKKTAAAKPARKAAPATRAVRKTAKSAATRPPNAAFMKAMTPSALLAAIVGAVPLPRTEVVKKVWDYIKQNSLQDAINKRMINADEKLKELFGKAKVSMFELTTIINRHLK